jgi:hypothetical protein
MARVEKTRERELCMGKYILVIVQERKIYELEYMKAYLNIFGLMNACKCEHKIYISKLCSISKKIPHKTQLQLCRVKNLNEEKLPIYFRNISFYSLLQIDFQSIFPSSLTRT